MRRLLLSLLCILPLAACNGYFGSGDDDGDGGSGGGSDSDIQGIWDGTLTSSTLFVDMLATPSNELWAISWNDEFNQVGQLTRGTGALNGNVFSGTGRTFAAGQDGTVGSATLSGTVASGESFDGSLGQNVTFTATFRDSYDDAYAQSAYTGTWRGRDSSNSPVTFTVDADGSFTASSAVAGQPSTCQISGSLSRSPSGKNYAAASFTVGSANCPTALANAGMEGVAFLVDRSGQQPLLMLAGTDSGQAVAWFAYARKDAETDTGEDTEESAEDGAQ